MGRGLVGDDVEPLAGRAPRRARSRRRCRRARSTRRSPAAAAARAQRERLGRVVGQPVDVADVEPPARPRLVDLDGEADALVHRHRQRLGAAHPAETGGQRRRVPRSVPPKCWRASLGERLVRALQDALGPDVDPRPGGHLAVHHQARPLELAEDAPRSPTCRRGSSWRSGRAAPTRGSGRRRPACPTGRAASRRRRARAARGRSRRRRPSDRAARPVPP